MRRLPFQTLVRTHVANTGSPTVPSWLTGLWRASNGSIQLHTLNHSVRVAPNGDVQVSEAISVQETHPRIAWFPLLQNGSEFSTTALLEAKPGEHMSFLSQQDDETEQKDDLSFWSPDERSFDAGPVAFLELLVEQDATTRELTSERGFLAVAGRTSIFVREELPDEDTETWPKVQPVERTRLPSVQKPRIKRTRPAKRPRPAPRTRRGRKRLKAALDGGEEGELDEKPDGGEDESVEVEEKAARGSDDESSSDEDEDEDEDDSSSEDDSDDEEATARQEREWRSAFEAGPHAGMEDPGEGDRAPITSFGEHDWATPAQASGRVTAEVSTRMEEHGALWEVESSTASDRTGALSSLFDDSFTFHREFAWPDGENRNVVWQHCPFRGVLRKWRVLSWGYPVPGDAWTSVRDRSSAPLLVDDLIEDFSDKRYKDFYDDRTAHRSSAYINKRRIDLPDQRPDIVAKYRDKEE